MATSVNYLHNSSIFPLDSSNISVIAEKCIGCGSCARECAFLQSSGKPRELARAILMGSHKWTPYDCSLCGLCSEVCPENLDIRSMLLFMRRLQVKAGIADLKPYRSLLAYEQRGRSESFRYFGGPNNCTTVFFPGCNLPGSRPEQTLWLYRKLKKHIDSLGIVLDCCLKPSHDLGRQELFNQHIYSLKEKLLKRGVAKILVACPSCYSVFKEYGAPIKVESVYEVLAKYQDSEREPLTIYRVHDACATRKEEALQNAVRILAENNGIQIKKDDHEYRKTVCCGEGGGVNCVSPELANQWPEKRTGENQTLPIITYCGGCSEFLGRRFKTIHILDVLCDPQTILDKSPNVYRSPRTYFNRIRLKRILKKMDADKQYKRDTTTSLPALVKVLCGSVTVVAGVAVFLQLFW